MFPGLALGRKLLDMNKRKLLWTGIVVAIVAFSVAPSAEALPALCQATLEDPFHCLPVP